MTRRTVPRIDPCFSCRLPDCDEASPNCNLKRVNNRYQAAKRRGRLSDISDVLRDGHTAWYAAYKLERDARRSEQAIPQSPQPEVTP